MDEDPQQRGGSTRGGGGGGASTSTPSNGPDWAAREAHAAKLREFCVITCPLQETHHYRHMASNVAITSSSGKKRIREARACCCGLKMCHKP